MKRIGLIMLTAILSVAWLVPSGQAAEKKGKKAAAKEAKEEAPAVAGITQGELAQLLVKILGLSRFLPVAPSDQQCFGILLDNNISPAGGWQADKVVTKADLARIIVQALKKQGDIENPDDPQEWIDYVKSLGIPIDSVGEAASYLQPLPEPVATHVVSQSVDPLVKRHRFNPVDEMHYGVDMESVVRTFSVLEFEGGEFRPLTPD